MKATLLRALRLSLEYVFEDYIRLYFAWERLKRERTTRVEWHRWPVPAVQMPTQDPRWVNDGSRPAVGIPANRFGPSSPRRGS